MRTSDLDYHLPPDLIATRPAEPRDHSRLLIYRRAAGAVEHRLFRDLPEYLLPTDLLITNNTRVLPAKLVLHRASGARIPGLFLAEEAPGLWRVMLKTRGRARHGDELRDDDYTFRLLEPLPERGQWRIQITPPTPAAEVLAAIGHVPLPPYIEQQRRQHGQPAEEPADRQHYQTIYAETADAGHSVAAPTAGLHFTDDLLARIAALGVQRAEVELQVGLGTFLPIETEDFESHPMHTEVFRIPAATIHALRQARARCARIIPVGTTAVRTLESQKGTGFISASPTAPTDLHGTTNLKIAPGYAFHFTDALITNFHLPRSTLLALVAALVGLDRLKELYALAIRERYRFYSYGDAMLILP